MADAEIEIRVEGKRWSESAVAVIDGALRAALLHLGLADEDVAISVLLTEDAEIATLNEAFRNKAQPTNVLSWPAQDLAAKADGAVPQPPEPDFDGTTELGDMALAHETCAREASEQNKGFDQHISHLAIHGLLHLLGYDHIRDADASRMELLETRILEKLGIDDPYCSDET